MRKTDKQLIWSHNFFHTGAFMPFSGFFFFLTIDFTVNVMGYVDTYITEKFHGENITDTIKHITEEEEEAIE